MNFVSRHPIEDLLAAEPAQPGPNTLSIPRDRALWSVLAHRGSGAAVERALAAISGTSVRFCGPDEWLVVADRAGAGAIGPSLAAVPGASVVEQGDGRTVFSLAGPDSRALLAKCTALDLHPDAFAIGRATNALVCHVGGNVARVGRDAYEITVMRSFAVSFFTEIRLLGQEFALTARFVD